MVPRTRIAMSLLLCVLRLGVKASKDAALPQRDYRSRKAEGRN
jgi:hypothetical protein